MELWIITGVGGILLPVSLFWLVYKRHKTSLWCGFFFLYMLAGLGAASVLLAGYFDFRPFLLVLLAILALVILLIAFGVYILIVFLFFNARQVLKKEKRTLANSLTLLLGILLTVLVIASFLVGLTNNLPQWVYAVQGIFSAVVTYYVLHATLFLITLIICNWVKPRKKQDYIVILGSGLINGKVPPLLGGRIDKAINFYKKQQLKRCPPRLICSGGQGSDEPCPEAEAMAAYAIEKGIPKEDVLQESASVNTLQNMQFSRKIIEEQQAGQPYNCIFSTSNYHLLRAGNYARKAGLQADGIGAKTAGYYWPTAVIREYIAHLKMRLRFHAFATGGIILVGIAMFVFLQLMGPYTL